MGLLGEITTEEYQEALKPQAPPEPFAKGTKVQVEIKEVGEKRTSEASGYDYHFLNLVLTNDEGVSRYARNVFSFSPKAKQMNIKFLAAFSLNANDLDDMSQLVGLVGRGVAGEPETYTGNDGVTKHKTTLWYMELPN